MHPALFLKHILGGLDIVFRVVPVPPCRLLNWQGALGYIAYASNGSGLQVYFPCFRGGRIDESQICMNLHLSASHHLYVSMQINYVDKEQMSRRL